MTAKISAGMVVSKFRQHGSLRIFVATKKDYYKTLSFANGKNWRIVESRKELGKTVYECEQISKVHYLGMELDNDEAALSKIL